MCTAGAALLPEASGVETTPARAPLASTPASALAAAAAAAAAAVAAARAAAARAAAASATAAADAGRALDTYASRNPATAPPISSDTSPSSHRVRRAGETPRYGASDDMVTLPCVVLERSQRRRRASPQGMSPPPFPVAKAPARRALSSADTGGRMPEKRASRATSAAAAASDASDDPDAGVAAPLSAVSADGGAAGAADVAAPAEDAVGKADERATSGALAVRSPGATPVTGPVPCGGAGPPAETAGLAADGRLRGAGRCRAGRAGRLGCGGGRLIDGLVGGAALTATAADGGEDAGAAGGADDGGAPANDGGGPIDGDSAAGGVLAAAPALGAGRGFAGDAALAPPGRFAGDRRGVPPALPAAGRLRGGGPAGGSGPPAAGGGGGGGTLDLDGTAVTPPLAYPALWGGCPAGADGDIHCCCGGGGGGAGCCCRCDSCCCCCCCDSCCCCCCRCCCCCGCWSRCCCCCCCCCRCCCCCCMCCCCCCCCCC